MRKAVIFDFDNTLSDRRIAFYKYSNEFIDYFININDINKDSIIEYMRIEDRDGYRSKYEFYNLLLDEYEFKNDVTVHDLLDHWNTEFYKHTTLKPDAIKMIKYFRLRRYKLGIITNGGASGQNKKIDSVGIRKYFGSILVSGEIGIEKPQIKIFNMMLDELDVSSENAYYIGDHPICDIIGAKSAGLTPIWLTGCYEWDHELEPPKYIINNLTDLKRIIK